MGKKILAAFLTLTVPIWFVPVALGGWLYFCVYELYKDILVFLEEKNGG